MTSIGNSCFRFTHGIVRTPADSVTEGLRAGTGAGPEPGRFRDEHSTYSEALERCGLEVTRLPALESFPDSVFVEDAAICLPSGAVVLRPGAPSRAGESAEMEPALRAFYPSATARLPAGSVDGGDVLVTGREVVIGLSARTDAEGAGHLAEIAESWGLRVTVRQTPDGVLHFKSDCAALDGDTILVTERLAASGCFDDYRCILVPTGEEPAANAVRVNDHVLVADGYPETRGLLEREGFDCMPVTVREAAKLDGGLSCMSLRFSRPA